MLSLKPPVPPVQLRAASRPAALFGCASLVLLAFVVVSMWTSNGSSLRPTVHLAEELVSAAAVVAILTACISPATLPTRATPSP